MQYICYATNLLVSKICAWTTIYHEAYKKSRQWEILTKTEWVAEIFNLQMKIEISNLQAKLTTLDDKQLSMSSETVRHC